MPQALSVSMPLVLTISTGMLLVALSRDSARVAWKPFMPGSTTSISTRSGSSRLQVSMPSSALPDASTWWPLRSSSWVSTAVSVGESSISRIFAIVCPTPRSGVVDVLSDGVEEFLAREWFGDVLLGTHDAPARLVEQAVLGGQHDHRRLLEHLIVLDQRAGLVAVQARHHDVDEDDLRLLVGDLGERLETVGRGRDLGTLALEQGLGGAADGFRVIDHHHPQAPEAAGATVVLRHLQIPHARRFVNAGAAANRLISQSAATLSSIVRATTKLNATQSATLAGTPANICQNLPRNAGNAPRRHCRDGPHRVDQDRQGFHLRDA